MFFPKSSQERALCAPLSIRRLNIEHFRRVLAQTNDPAKCQQILKLLAEEETKSDIPNRDIPPGA
jgi:hypothetical protein